MSEPTRTDLTFAERSGELSGILLVPESPTLLYVMAHGAGAPMTHPFMEGMAWALTERGVATLRFNFPFTEAGRKRPDSPPRLHAAIQAAVATAREQLPDVLMVAGGKSLGGRMTSQTAASEPLDGVRGLVFLGFPLHAPAKPGSDRANHLQKVAVPMLFLQGTRDALARLELMEPVCASLGDRATLHIVDGADHGFSVPKRTGKTPDDVRSEMADVIVEWARGL
jgi:predicted alpha/beta-hydrolase family hydrolase